MLGAFGLNESMVRWLNDLADQGIFTTDSEFRIRGWNRWLETHSGLETKDVLGRSLFDVFPYLVERGFREIYRQATQGHVQVLSQRFHQYLLRLPAPLGLPFSEMQQSARIAPLYRDNKVLGTVTVITDVTERIVRESELKQARDAAEQANRAKDDFLATLAHELRNPINNVLGWTEVLRKRTDNPGLLEQALRSIEENTCMQMKLVEDLIDIARIVSGKREMKIEDLELGSTIRSTLETSYPLAERKGVALTTVCKDALWIKGDGARLRQVITNLVNNAIKFTPAGGSVCVRIRGDRDAAEIRVEDTGAGIEPSLLPHIFERFRQGNRSEGGLGLGLDVVRRLVALHGGTVAAHSDGEGRGAVFTVRIPLSASKNIAVQ